MKKKLIEIISAVLALLMLLSPVTAFALEYEIPAHCMERPADI